MTRDELRRACEVIWGPDWAWPVRVCTGIRDPHRLGRKPPTEHLAAWLAMLADQPDPRAVGDRLVVAALTGQVDEMAFTEWST